MSNEQVIKQLNSKYKLGFHENIENFDFPIGLNKDIIYLLSKEKNEPQWLLDWRFQAYEYWLTQKEKDWANISHPPIDYQSIYYFNKPKKINSNNEIDPELKAYFEKLGVPLHEQEVLAGNVAVDAVLDSQSIGTTFKEQLLDLGIIFCSFSEAVQNHPSLVQKYLGSVVSYRDNFFAALNSAVFSDGSFCYIPKGVRSPMELSTYFRINKANTGQFERTLIISEEDSYVSYLEGCFTKESPIWTPNGIVKIEEIKAGDYVFDHLGQSQKVKNTMIRPYKEKIVNIKGSNSDYIIQATLEHPFLIISKKSHKSLLLDNAKWVNASELNQGDFLFTPHSLYTEQLSHEWKHSISTHEGYWTPIQNIFFSNYNELVYNFEVEDTNTYLVHGFAVHNCSAPARSENQLHAAVVEIIAHKNAKVYYSTVQNWFPGDEQGIGGVYNFVTKRGMCLGDSSHISWTQVETGSSITHKYPSVILKGDNSTAEFYSVALTNHYQQADTGTKMIHFGKNTKSTIISKSISAGVSNCTYRGLVRISKNATGARNFTQCDSLIFGKSKVYTHPYIENHCFNAQLEHEATTSTLSDEHLFYLSQRGLNEEKAKNMLVNGFCKSIFQKLPGEFAVEAQKLLEINLEGSLG